MTDGTEKSIPQQVADEAAAAPADEAQVLGRTLALPAPEPVEADSMEPEKTIQPAEAAANEPSVPVQVPETDQTATGADATQPAEAELEATKALQPVLAPTTPPPVEPVDDHQLFTVEDGVLGKLALMHTPIEEVFVKADNGSFYDAMPVESPRFLKHIAWRSYKTSDAVPSKAELKKVMRKLAWTGLFDGAQNASFIRYAKIGDTLYVDLADRAGHYVEITADGWNLHRHDINSPWFLRKPSMLEQVKPEKGGSIADLARFLNVRSEEQFILIAAFILGAMYPNGPFPMLTVHGPQGAAKSTMLRIIGSLVDPSVAVLTSEPKSEQDLFIAASHGWLQCIDNVSAIKDKMSNAYCRLTTGGTFRTRKLYTTNEEVVITVKRPVAFNGITPFAKQNDFLDRSIWIELSPIAASDRRTESEFWAEWERARPKILGAFYSAMATALKNYDQVKLDSLPRLADFARWVVAAEPACPWEGGKFLSAYEANRAEMVDMAIEADPIATAALRLMAGQNAWRGTSTELFRALHALVPEDLRKQSDWPQAPVALSNRLMRLEGFLATKGIEIVRKRLPDRRLIILSKSERQPAALADELPSLHDPSQPAVETVEVEAQEADAEQFEVEASLAAQYEAEAAPATVRARV